MTELEPAFSRAPHCFRLIAADVGPSDALAIQLESILSGEYVPYGYVRAVIPATSQAVCQSVFTDVGPGEPINIPVVSVGVERNLDSTKLAVTLGPCPARDKCFHWRPK